MRTGGAGLSQSSQFLHAAAKAGPAISTGAIGCSTRGGVFCNGTTIGRICAAAAKTKLANIARAVDVDYAARCGRWRVHGEPADDFRDLVGRGDSAKGNVGNDLRPAASLQI